MYIYCDKYYECKYKNKEECFRRWDTSIIKEGEDHIYYNEKCQGILYKEIKIKYISDFEAEMIKVINESKM